MKKLLLSLATQEIRAIAEPFLQNHKAYAERNGYVYQCAEEVHWEDKHPSFSKVWTIHQGLVDGYDFVIWADADVAFTNFSVDLSRLVKDQDYFMAAYWQRNWKSWKYLCAGLTVWKNTPDAIAFVKAWIKHVEEGTMLDMPYEQWWLDLIVRETNYAGIRPCTADEIGCFSSEIWHDGIKWKPGMPTIHFAGPASMERKASVFETTYASQVIR